MKILHRHVVRLALMALTPLCVAQAPPASAPSAGTAPLRFVIPLPPGTAQDGIARRLAERLQATTGKTVIVDNKPGASGILATDTVVKSPADGSVLSLTMASTITIAPHTFRKLPYDPLRDLKPIVRVATTPLVLAVNASNPARNLREFLDHARKNPDKVSYASFGVGTSAHLLGEELNRKAGVKLLHVPYKTVAVADLLGGAVDSAISDFGSIRDFLRPPARLRVLALTGDGRNREYPDIPTFGEQGLPSIDPMVGWIGVFAPAGLPDANVAQFAKDMASLIDGPEMQQTLRSYGYDAGTLVGEPLRQYVREDHARWGAITKAVGLEPN